MSPGRAVASQSNDGEIIGGISLHLDFTGVHVAFGTP